MALNFPNAPVDQEQHSENGQTWVWHADPGCWSVLTTEDLLSEITIVEADTNAGFQVWGDVLLQWGSGTTDANGDLAVTFPNAFKSTPTVTANTRHHTSGTDYGYTAGVRATSGLTSCVIGATTVIDDNSFPSSGREVYWTAVGEAPDALKQPKTVRSLGGDGGTGEPGEPTTIVEADTDAGWQVWGDTLIQWGLHAASGTGAGTVTYPHPYKTVPNVVAVSNATSAEIVKTTVASVEVDDFLIYQKRIDNGEFFAGSSHWISVGEATDDMKQPKTVQTVGGSELQEFHDPTNAASWRIVGSTLECWGRIAGDAGTPVVFPKKFMNTPAVTTSAASSSARYHMALATFEQVTVTCLTATSAVTATNVAWHAIGEWDGIS